ncbi:hypothetical protein CROQUDRAFT_45862 [Cronartium quercuum f. sp. fusiforme G11]|uniref:alpha-1,2-Mannosidase n=1 Tax=Cronartium quercuum f. sp. fusiforme G11 TaxID=708437 RepID=A0A9P6TAK7_9BASI|nr:hypothetical protein CROQUDRAFT_45862 [Cronartium quercuum f. sp. fusiforme G11]
MPSISIFNVVRLFTFIAFLGLWGNIGHCVATVQKAGLVQTDEAKARATAIRDAFSSAYQDYMQLAYPADEILPVSKGSQNTRNGCLVDALSTLFVMDLKDTFNDAVQKTLKIDFTTSQTPDPVSVFESVIRYVGGIVSAYELSGSENQALLDQARVLSDKLVYAWKDQQQQLPNSFIWFHNNTAATSIVSLAAAGSLIIEFDRLSLYTKDPKYRNVAERSMKFLMNTTGVFPGLPALRYRVSDNSIQQDRVTWGVPLELSSYYEYLLKYAMLITNKDTSYLKSWRKAVRSSIKYLITSSTSQNMTYLADYSASEGGKRYLFSHLACFSVCPKISTGGNWMMGAKVLNDHEILRYGTLLVDSCMKSYTSTKSGLGPEIFNFFGPNGETTGEGKPSSQDVEFYKANGFYISNPKYVLRPEVIESAFYGWRITGEKRYQDFVWGAFQALQASCKAPKSYSAIDDVNSPRPKLLDNCESFL